MLRMPVGLLLSTGMRLIDYIVITPGDLITLFADWLPLAVTPYSASAVERHVKCQQTLTKNKVSTEYGLL